MKIYNTFLEKYLLPIGDFFLGSCYMKELQKWRKICQLSEQEIQSLGDANLRNILDYSIKSIPFYSNLGIISHSDLKKYISQFPIMTKKDIKENLDTLLVSDNKGLIAVSSSGSSGIQGTVYINKREQSISRAIQTLWWEWSGYYVGKKILQTGLVLKRGFVKKMKDIVFRVKYTSAFTSSEQEIIRILAPLKNKCGWFLGGYPSSLNIFANITKKKNIQICFDNAVCWGDKLFDHYKKNVKEAFGCDIYETYGCSEGFMVAAKKDLDYFYIMSPHTYIEIIDKKGNSVEDGQMGYVLLTRLDGYSMPLIRYYVGDMAIKLPKEKYPEKREMKFPLLEKVMGRDSDIMYTQSGKYLTVHFFSGILTHIPEIIQFKVVQYTLNTIEIWYVPSKNFSLDVLSEVEKIIHNHLQESFPIIWKKVNSIAPSPSGKPQLTESHLNINF